MSVATTMPIVQNLGLVQVNDADPSRLLKWNGTVVADGTAGTLTASCIVPVGFGVIWLGLSCQIAGTTANNVAYAITEDGNTLWLSGADSRLIGTFISPDSLVPPPPLLMFGETITSLVVAVNNDTEDMQVVAVALAWEQRAARNLPQRFFWPGLVL